MIYLTKGQPLVDNSGMIVCDPTGYYNDGDSVACAPWHMPEEAICRYEAKFIAYGGMVYSIADEAALLEEVKKLNPESLFGKNKEEVAIDKIVENIVTQETGENIKKPTVEEVVIPAATTTEAVIAPPAPAENIPTPVVSSTPPVSEPVPTTEPVVVVPVVEPIPTPEAPVVAPNTSTPETIIETVTQISNTVDKIVNIGSDLNNLVQ